MIESLTSLEHRLNISADTSFESVHYKVSYYRRSNDRLAIVFSSAGKWGAGEPIEEFKNTILKTGISAIFIICKGIEWYNNEETAALIEMLCSMTDQYGHTCTLGESMGGSGALMLARYHIRISRVLAFSPQFSIKPPFVDFDFRYREIGNAVHQHLHADFASETVKDRAVLLFGSHDQYDYIHAAMFHLHGFAFLRIADSDHMVARHLKYLRSGNLLMPLIDLVCDFNRAFSTKSVESLLHHVIDPDSKRHMLADSPELQLSFQLPRRNNVALGKTARQSSTSPWSFPPNTDTASSAVSRMFSPDFSFHTEMELDPWWQVDLADIFRLQEIRIYNRRSNPERFTRFTINISLDLENWQTIHRKDDDQPITKSSDPFVWKAVEPVYAQHVRISLIGVGILHLSRVEVIPVESGIE